MATMTIKYDNRNKTVKKLLDSLIYSGAIQPIDEKSKRVAEFKSALRETQIIAKDIAANGTKEYKTLDDLLDEDHS
ncbi:MAG: hypothetical protein LBC19_07020 [Tannerella sp.]|jgi:hypothetical protein|nr:hypothetical protein [Tannerella sp.]